MADMQTHKGIEYIKNSKRPYPEWIRNHILFSEMPKIDKVFPRIGLPNCKEPCEIMNSTEALADANRLGQRLIQELTSSQRALYIMLDTSLKSKEKDRNDICCKLQSLVDLLGKIIRSMQFNDYAKVVEGKVGIRLRDDIFNGDSRPLFRKDEPILRVVNKLSELILAQKGAFVNVDQLPEFKDFSRTNVVGKKYNLVFSSYGEDGAWDIATASMRGIVSCQAWNSPQSRGLIGSIASKFVGMIYLASDQEVPGYGSKMLNRAMVRFCINETTKKPSLLMDTVYPAANADILATFKKFLKEKSGLDVFYTRNDGIGTHYIPDEPSRKSLKQGEFSYMDAPIPVKEHIPAIRIAPENITVLTDDFKKMVCEEVGKSVSVRRDMYDKARITYDALKIEFEAARRKWLEDNVNTPEDQRPKFELQEPRMDRELMAFGGGGIVNLFKHCDKRHNNDLNNKQLAASVNSAGYVFAKMVLTSFEVPGASECENKEEYHRKFLMGFLKKPGQVKLASLKAIQGGSWMKSFPRSAEKFFEYVFGQMKHYVMSSCRDMIKKSN